MSLLRESYEKAKDHISHLEEENARLRADNERLAAQSAEDLRLCAEIDDARTRLSALASRLNTENASLRRQVARNELAGKVLHYINGDPTDNRIENLAVLDASENRKKVSR